MAEMLAFFAAMINHQDKDTGDSALHYGCRNVTDFEGFKNHVVSGINVHLRNNNGRTALHEAAKFSPLGVEAIKLLVEYEADINAIDKEGSTILHDALKNPEVKVEIIEFLLQRKAYPNFRDMRDLPPLAYVESSSLSDSDKKIVSELLMKYGILRNFREFNFSSTKCFEADEILCLHFLKNQEKLREYQKFRALCIQEVLAIGRKNIRPRLSLFNVIYKHCFEKTLKLEDNAVKKILSGKNKYPIFGDIILEAIRFGTIKTEDEDA